MTYLLHSNPYLALCPIMSFSALAFADNAFAVVEPFSPAQLFQLKVPTDKAYLPIAFKPSALEKPLFRDASGEALTI